MISPANGTVRLDEPRSLGRHKRPFIWSGQMAGYKRRLDVVIRWNQMSEARVRGGFNRILSAAITKDESPRGQSASPP